MANMTPPIGVLKVAAMPAPAPAATRADPLPRRHADDLSQRRAERRANLDDRPFAPTDDPLPIAMAEASDLTNATTGRMTPPL